MLQPASRLLTLCQRWLDHIEILEKLKVDEKQMAERGKRVLRLQTNAALDAINAAVNSRIINNEQSEVVVKYLESLHSPKQIESIYKVLT